MCTPEHDCHAQRTFLLKSKSQQKTTMQKMYKPSKIKCPFRWRWKASWYSKQKISPKVIPFGGLRERENTIQTLIVFGWIYISPQPAAAASRIAQMPESFFERLIKNLLRSVRRENNFSVFRRVFFFCSEGLHLTFGATHNPSHCCCFFSLDFTTKVVEKWQRKSQNCRRKFDVVNYYCGHGRQHVWSGLARANIVAGNLVYLKWE